MKDELLKKVVQLREKYLGNDDSQKYLDDVETEIETLFEEYKLAEHPVFKKIADDAERRLNEINALLMNDENLQGADVQRLHGQKKAWQFVFSRFKMTPHDQAISLLNTTLDSKLGQ